MADETKPVPVPSSSLIPVGGTNFSSMNDISQLQSVEAQAPAWHSSTIARLKAAGKIREETIQPEQFKQAVSVQQSKVTTFGTGARVMTSEGKKVTIIQASAGYTKKTKTPVHRVANKAGKTWLEKETNLTLLL